MHGVSARLTRVTEARQTKGVKTPVPQLSVRKREGRLSSETVAALNSRTAARFGNRFTASEAIRKAHGHTLTWLENQPPDAVVFAEFRDDVVDLVKPAPA